MANLDFSHPSILSSGFLQENSPRRPGLVLVTCMHFSVLHLLLFTAYYIVSKYVHISATHANFWLLYSQFLPAPYPRIHWRTRI